MKIDLNAQTILTILAFLCFAWGAVRFSIDLSGWSFAPVALGLAFHTLKSLLPSAPK